MAILSPTFVLGIAVLLYLSSFVCFAVLRILTGLSIQRIGYLSLRRLGYTPRDGLKFELRGLGINLHRPTFAQPTWVSVVLTDLTVTVDIKALENNRINGNEEDHEAPSEDPEEVNKNTGNSENQTKTRRRSNTHLKRSQSWERLTKLKERIKRLHRKINWIRLVDVVASNSSLVVNDVGTVQVGSFTMAVDTRRKMVDRGRMFTHWKKQKKVQRPAEWMLTARSVLFTPTGQESLEVLDHATLNIHGLLYQELDGLRDAAIALKLGRVHVPIDDIRKCFERFKALQKEVDDEKDTLPHEEVSVSDIFVELDRPGSQNHNIVQTVSDSKEFISSILRGIKEVQFAVSYIGATVRIKTVQPAGTPIYLNASMKEVGVDLHRLDPKSPAHRMYFSPKDIAHQALVAALSIAIGVDDGNGKSDRLVYIPMATMTMRTTLPSKTINFAEDNSAAERNANMLFANAVVTSPSLDLDPKHLPLVLALLAPKPRKDNSDPHNRRAIVSRLLPKANIKFSMHEPVMRIALPPVDPTADEDDFDLIISSISSVSLDLESSHSAVGDTHDLHDLHYALASTFRVQSHDLYYQTSAATRYDLLQTESMELKCQINASPDLHVVASGTLQTFSVHMVRPEINAGLRQIVRQLRSGVEPTKKAHARTSRDPNFIRAFPPWLLHFQFQASDFSAEVAGVDEEISEDTRGVVLQLDSWNAEYRAQRLDTGERRPSRRHRALSRSLTPETELLQSAPTSPRKKQQLATDGRRLAIHVRGLEGFVVESAGKWELEPFVAIPRFELAFTTSSDHQGPIFHFNTHVRTVLLQYSLYRHYAVGVATMVLLKALVRTRADKEELLKAQAKAQSFEYDQLSPLPRTDNSAVHNRLDYNFVTKELFTIDFKATLVQVKATLPSDPPLMLQIYGMEAGRNRWSPPFFHAKLMRLYAEAPKMKKVWARLVSLKTVRVDLRESRKKLSTGGYQEDKIIDINTEAIRLAVPHQLVLHKVFDNVVNTMKATEQLHHRFKTGTNDYILEKFPEGPKRVPRISLRSRALLFELEDGAFEWKLGTIYRTGLIEQQGRIAREEAFNVKSKKIEEEEQKRKKQASSNYRSGSENRRTQTRDESSRRRAASDDEQSSRGRSPASSANRRMRYDPEGMCGIGDSAKVSIEVAKQNMLRYNAQSWKKRIDHSYNLQKTAMKDLRGVFWGRDQLPDEMEETENILEVPQRPALMGLLISDLHIIVDKPSFPLDQLPEFLHRIGKGMPRDMQYGLLIPMHVQIDMGEARMTLRDYPLPLLHVPAIRPGQSTRLPAWSLKTDFVIAEEFRGPQSVRRVEVEVVPPRDIGKHTSNEGRFAIDVRRTISPVKSYSDLNIEINTSFPTRLTWGSSYQPAIQDMMMVIEGFTKPQVDASDRTGFWDKIRLSFHSRVLASWKGDGDVHLMLKGTRDPYAVLGTGAGFLMCWRNDVQWSIWREDDPKKFMAVDSGDYILAIPDYSHHARGMDRTSRDDESVASSDSYKSGAIFKKVVMKLSGNVQWLAGLVFERNVDDGTRSFDFAPHYEVVLKDPKYTKNHGKSYDAFRGFRSHHIHMSIAVKAPVDRDWSPTNTKPSGSYNTVHLTPRFFTHFFAWWATFGGAMSLPIRQGQLWPGIEKSSKKFGRHLATIKYNLLLAPLFMSHIYKHKEAEDYSDDVVSVTGLKIRLDSFMLDMHQRREEFNTHEKGRKTQTKTTGLRFHRAQLDLLSADVRAISASIACTTPDELRKASVANIIASQFDNVESDLSRFEIPDNDFSWIDMDDFIELDWILPSEANPETKIMPLAFSPRITYFRQTDHGDTIAGDPERTSPFGHEPTHFCIMSHDDDPRRVQCQLIQDRINRLETQREDHSRNLGEAELNMIRDDGKDPSLKIAYEELRGFETRLNDKHLFLKSMLRRMSVRIHDDVANAVPEGEDKEGFDAETPSSDDSPTDTEGIDTNPAAEYISNFNNRFVIHNIHLKWNNSLRNTLLRYIHQVSQRRGSVYYLSRRAVKFILDIVEEQSKAKAPKTDSPQRTEPTQYYGNPASAQFGEPMAEAKQSDPNVENRIKELLADAKKFVNADEDKQTAKAPEMTATEHLSGNVGKDFTPQDSYHLRLIAPQIQLQSEKNAKSVVLVTAKGMELKVVEVMDKARMFDDVSGLVQRRFSVAMDSTQFFVTQQKWFSAQLLPMYSGGHYGTPAGSAWPPWVPLEVMFDFEIDPFGFKRVVQKTSASLRYDKYNTLRLKYNDEIGNDGTDVSAPDSIESRMDHLWVEFPQIRAICDSTQYYAMYIIVLDLLLYSEPLEKTRTERLEKIMLASDFSDLSGAPEMVVRLQERIRQLDEIKTQFQIYAKSLDKKGWEDRIALEQDLAGCEDELFFMMKAITTSQRKYDGSQNNGLLRWNIASKQIVWHLMKEKDQPLMEFQLKNAEYDRTDNSDGSHVNLMQIGQIVGLNLLPDAIYPEMIAPYVDGDRGTATQANQQMLRVYWYMLEAIAGIPVMDHFEVNLFPMKIQLEREVGKKLFEYIFPSSGEKEKEKASGATSMMQDIPSEDETTNIATKSKHLSVADAERRDANTSTRAGSLELRLRPTLTSEGPKKIKKSRTMQHPVQNSDAPHFRLFQSNRTQSKPAMGKKASVESLRSVNTPRPLTIRRSTNNSLAETASTTSDGKSRRFGLHRNNKDHDKQKASDDLTKMISRASNFMTFAYVKIPSVVLCLSYKGKGERNLEDVHDFVFRMPELGYRNKTWSNLDLALALKKDVIKALISHTGAIIGNKFSKHRPNTAQQSRLRELVSSSIILAPPNSISTADSSLQDISSDTSSFFASSPTDTRSETSRLDSRRSERSRSPRRSTQSTRESFDGTRSTIPSVSSTQSFRGMSGHSSHSMLGSSPPVSMMSHGHKRPGTGNSSLREGHRNSSLLAMTSLENGGELGIEYDRRSLGGSTHGNGGFMSDTKLGRKLSTFGGKLRGGTDPATSSMADESEEQQSKRKPKLLLGKKILSNS